MLYKVVRYPTSNGLGEDEITGLLADQEHVTASFDKDDFGLLLGNVAVIPAVVNKLSGFPCGVESFNTLVMMW